MCTCVKSRQPVQKRTDDIRTPKFDPITETFSQLIDPSLGCVGTARHRRTNLRLEGLKKCEPRRYQITDNQDEADGHVGDMSPDLEVDGPHFTGTRDMNYEMSVRVKHMVYTCLVYNSCTLYML